MSIPENSIDTLATSEQMEQSTSDQKDIGSKPPDLKPVTGHASSSSSSLNSSSSAGSEVLILTGNPVESKILNVPPQFANMPRISGTVKFFNSQKGFGFIIPTENAETGEVFVHHTAIVNSGGFRSLGENEEVEYYLIDTPKGPQAQYVTGPNGQSVKGDSYVAPSFFPINLHGNPHYPVGRGHRGGHLSSGPKSIPVVYPSHPHGLQGHHPIMSVYSPAIGVHHSPHQSEAILPSAPTTNISSEALSPQIAYGMYSPASGAMNFATATADMYPGMAPTPHPGHYYPYVQMYTVPSTELVPPHHQQPAPTATSSQESVAGDSSVTHE